MSDKFKFLSRSPTPTVWLEASAPGSVKAQSGLPAGATGGKLVNVFGPAMVVGIKTSGQMGKAHLKYPPFPACSDEIAWAKLLKDEANGVYGPVGPIAPARNQYCIGCSKSKASAIAKQYCQTLHADWPGELRGDADQFYFTTQGGGWKAKKPGQIAPPSEGPWPVEWGVWGWGVDGPEWFGKTMWESRSRGGTKSSASCDFDSCCKGKGYDAATQMVCLEIAKALCSGKFKPPSPVTIDSFEVLDWFPDFVTALDDNGTGTRASIRPSIGLFLHVETNVGFLTKKDRIITPYEHNMSLESQPLAWPWFSGYFVALIDKSTDAVVASKSSASWGPGVEVTSPLPRDQLKGLYLGRISSGYSVTWVNKWERPVFFFAARDPYVEWWEDDPIPPSMKSFLTSKRGVPAYLLEVK